MNYRLIFPFTGMRYLMSSLFPIRFFPWATALLISTTVLLALVVSLPTSVKNSPTQAPANAESATATPAPTERGAPLTAADITKQATTAAGHRVEAVADGARIICQMQDLEGLLTPNGLEIRSVDDGEPGAAAVRTMGIGRTSGIVPVGSGVVTVDGNTARLIRPGLIEEVTTSSDGVRQDWLIAAPPNGQGDLVLDLRFDSAAITAVTDDQVALTLAGGRQVVWHRLAVSDARGTTLNARFAATELGVQVAVDDAHAVYPVRIDPTYTDADWVSMGGAGPNGVVRCLAIDHTGALILGGVFTKVGDTQVNYIARWNGTTWSSLATGMDDVVNALAVSGTDLYVGGWFSTAGGIRANNIAKWNGTTWSALAVGTNNQVRALAVWGTDLYAGGDFTTAGGIEVNRIAKWNGKTWSPLAAGMDNFVYSLAVSETDLYAGGDFTTAGGIAASYIAKWNGTTWSPLAAGVNNFVRSLAVSGTDLYAGGWFNSAGGNAANHIAKWSGSTWSPLAAGMGGSVEALVVSGTDLYAGGWFTSAGGSSANYIAKWNGTTWSPLATGLNYGVRSLAVSATDLYAGGDFTTAGGKGSAYIARLVQPFAIDYQANGATGGTVPASQSKSYNVPVTLATNSGSMVKTGLTFAGWNTAADGSGTTYAAGASYSANAAVTLYAQWAIPYNVTYDANGATGGTVPAVQIKAHGFDLTLASNSGSLVKTGLTFAGWNTAANGSGTTYAAGANYSANAAVTLYAQWAIPYNVTYDANGATGGTVPAAQIKAHGVDLTLASNSGSLVKTGLVFAGWNTTADGSGTNYAAGATYTANAALTLYAKWQVSGDGSGGGGGGGGGGCGLGSGLGALGMLLMLAWRLKLVRRTTVTVAHKN
jgi:Listeria-Bacteroides repeat domain (List_Bact_rpt)